MSRLISLAALLCLSTIGYCNPPLALEASKDGIRVRMPMTEITAKKAVYDGKGELLLTGPDVELAIRGRLPGDGTGFTIEPTENGVRVTTKNLEATPEFVQYHAESEHLLFFTARPRPWQMKQAKTLKVFRVVDGVQKQEDRVIWQQSTALTPMAYSLREGRVSSDLRQVKR